MDPPLIRGGELSDEVVFDEELDGMFANVSGWEEPDGRPFSLDLEGDILDGLLGHPVIPLVCVLQLRRTYESIVVRSAPRIGTSLGGCFFSFLSVFLFDTVASY